MGKWSLCVSRIDYCRNHAMLLFRNLLVTRSLPIHFQVLTSSFLRWATLDMFSRTARLKERHERPWNSTQGWGSPTSSSILKNNTLGKQQISHCQSLDSTRNCLWINWNQCKIKTIMISNNKVLSIVGDQSIIIVSVKESPTHNSIIIVTHSLLLIVYFCFVKGIKFIIR